VGGLCAAAHSVVFYLLSASKLFLFVFPRQDFTVDAFVAVDNDFFHLVHSACAGFHKAVWDGGV